MSFTAFPRLGLAGLAAAGLLLAGCGQSATTSPAPAATTSPTTAESSPAPSSAAPSSASPSATPEASSTPTQAAPAAVKNTCTVISGSEMEKLVGADLGTVKNAAESGGSLCTYGLTSKGRTLVIAGAGPSSGSLNNEAGEVKKDFKNSKLTPITLSGTDEALLLTANESGANVTGVIARKGGYAYLSVVLGLKSQDAYEKIDRKVVAELIAS